MPAPVTGRHKKTDAILGALRAHIIRERQKKKQEQEADAEVERKRKEREHQQKQDVMTLGETTGQVQQLETRLAQLKEEKHQLFLQLKKVLNEDDIRRRQLVKESSEMVNMQGYSQGTVTYSNQQPQPQQLFLQPNMSLSGRTALYKVPPGHASLITPVSQYDLLSNGLPRGTLKRSRSPSPPQSYHPSYNYKPGAIPHYPQQKMDDGRRGHEYGRAVLWNKNPPSSPYGSAQSGAYYSHPPASQVASTTVSYAPTTAQTVYSYSSSGHPQYAQAPPGAPAPPRDEAGKHAAAGIFISHQQPPPQQAQGPPRSLPQHGQAYVGLHPQLEHREQKPPAFSAQEAEKYYGVAPGGVSIRPATHVPIHGGAIPIQQAPQGAKSGGITSGYPIRGQPSPHVTSGSYQPSTSTPHSVYVSQAPAARLSYSQAAPPPPGHGPPPPPGHGQPPSHNQPPSHGPSPGRYSVPGLQREV